MSTRCQIKIKDSFGEEIWFYRHCDGYPDGVKESLFTFLDYVKKGIIRDNAEQSSGWLVIIGHNEYDISDIPNSDDSLLSGWKVGAYEPCSPNIHGDIEFFYTIDLEHKRIMCEDIYKETEFELK